MLRQRSTILGLSPGTRYVGYAVMRDHTELLDWGVKTFKGEWSEGKLQRIIRSIDRIVQQYEVKVIAMKSVSSVYCSDPLKELYKEISRYCEENHIHLSHYSLQDIQAHYEQVQKDQQKENSSSHS